MAVEQVTSLVGPGGHLTPLEVTSGPDRYQSPAMLPPEATEIVNAAVKVAKKGDVAATVEVDPDFPPAQVIVGWAADYSLLAMGAPLSSWLEGAHNASATDAAISHLPTALLIARGTSPDDVADRIVVASDGSDVSERLVELAVQIALPRGSEVTLIHISDHRSRARVDRVETQKRALRQALGDQAHAEVRSGKARHEIVDAAEAIGATLVLMGSRGLRGVRAIGSVGRHVMHEAGCSVLLIPPN